jgi:exonuclease VII large subunit
MVLARGWSITRLSDGTLVRSPQDVSDGDTLVTALADGTVTSVASASGRMTP